LVLLNEHWERMKILCYHYTLWNLSYNGTMTVVLKMRASDRNVIYDNNMNRNIVQNAWTFNCSTYLEPYYNLTRCSYISFFFYQYIVGDIGNCGGIRCLILPTRGKQPTYFFYIGKYNYVYNSFMFEWLLNGNCILTDELEALKEKRQAVRQINYNVFRNFEILIDRPILFFICLQNVIIKL